MADTLTAAVPSSNSSSQQPAAPYERELSRAKRQDRSNILPITTPVLPLAPTQKETPRSDIAGQYKQITNLARFNSATSSVEDMATELLKTAAKQALKRGLWYYGPPALLAIVAVAIGLCVLLILLYGGYCFYHLGVTDSIRIWWNQDINTVLTTCSQ